MPFELSELAAEGVCYLTTTGRISAQPRAIEIWFAIQGNTLYMLSGNEERADWVKNAMREPRVVIEIRDQHFEGRARLVTDGVEDAVARRLLYEKYSPENSDLENWAKSSLPVAFDLVLP